MSVMLSRIYSLEQVTDTSYVLAKQDNDSQRRNESISVDSGQAIKRW